MFPRKGRENPIRNQDTSMLMLGPKVNTLRCYNLDPSLNHVRMKHTNYSANSEPLDEFESHTF